MDHPAVHLDRQNIQLAADLFRKNRHRVLVDAARGEIDVIDPEGVLDDFGNLPEGKNVSIDQRLGDVRLLLKTPALDQFRSDAGHGPHKGNQPLVLEAESALVGLWVSRYRHGFRWGAALALLYRCRASIRRFRPLEDNTRPRRPVEGPPTR